MRWAAIGCCALTPVACRDHEGDVGVAALMQADRLEAGFAPGGRCSFGDPARRERLPAAIGEHQPVAAGPLAQAVCDQLAAKRRRDRDAPPPGTALGVDQPGARIPRACDRDQVTVEVDVFPAQRTQLAATKPRVQRRGVDRSVVRAQSTQQRDGLVGPGHPLAPSAHRGQCQAKRRVLRHLRAGTGAAKDRPQRQDRIAHRARGKPLGH